MKSDSPLLAEFREMQPAERARWIRDLCRIDHRGLRRLLTFAALYAGCAAALVALDVGNPWHWLAIAPLAVLGGASLHGVSLFVHEGTHNALSRNRLVNRAIAVACAMPVLQNFAGYQVLHLEHHGDTGTDDDPDHYAAYTSHPRLLFCMHWLRLFLGYPVYVAAIPLLGWRHGTRTDRAWIAAELALCAGVVALVVGSLSPGAILMGWGLPMLVVSVIVQVRGMSQHTLLEEPDHRIRGTRTILCHPVVAYFMCNENYHLEHHLYPRVPWYRLPELHDALADDLRAEGAPFISSYSAFVRDFARESWRLLG